MYKHLNPSYIYNDRELALAAVETSGAAIRFMDETLKNDKEILTKALKHPGYGYILQYAGFLRRDEEFLIDLVTNQGIYMGDIWSAIDSGLRYNRKFLRKAGAPRFGASESKHKRWMSSIVEDVLARALVMIDGMQLRYLVGTIGEFGRDMLLLKDAVRQNGLALQFVPEQMRTRAMIEEALANNGLAFEFATQFHDDEEMASLAIEKNPAAFKYVAEELRNRREFVKTRGHQRR